MEAILEDLGLKDLKETFAVNLINPKDVLTLTDEEFLQLGVTAIGDKARLRERCRDSVMSSEESPILKRIKTFQSARSGKSKRALQPRKPKETRRIHVGWKHLSKGNSFRLVTSNKGGGTLTIDAPKSSKLQELTNIVAKHYFPAGMNHISGMKLGDMKYNLATFTGNAVKNTLQSGEDFTLGKYMEEYTFSPLRLYLHTCLKTEMDASLEENELPDIYEDSRNEDSSRQIFHTQQDNGPVVLEERQDDSVSENLGSANSSTSEFEDTDTPVISFRRRRLRLSLTRHNTGMADEDNLTPTTSHNEPMEDNVTTNMVNRALAYSTSQDDSVTEDNEYNEEFQFQAALRASLEITIPEQTQEGILAWWIQKTMKVGDSQPILIYRRNILDSTRRTVTRNDFEWERPVKVVFSGTHEIGDDLGGPMREYLRLLIEAIKNSILEGDEKKMTFQHSLQKLENGLYRLAGMCVSWSILQGGPGLPFLHDGLYRIITGDGDVHFDVDDVSDEDIRKNIKKIKEAKDSSDFEDIADWMIDQGLPTLISNETKATDIAEMAIKNFVYYRVHAEIEQFKEGLEHVGRFLKVLKANSSLLKCLLVHEEFDLTFEKMKSLVKYNFSEEGSNDRVLEEDTVYSFELFLQDCEDKRADVKLGDILSFWTGADMIPPLGFSKKLEVNFVQDKKLLPVAHTCEMSLEIPRGLDPESFSRQMIVSVTEGGEFHLA